MAWIMALVYILMAIWLGQTGAQPGDPPQNWPPQNRPPQNGPPQNRPPQNGPPQNRPPAQSGQGVSSSDASRISYPYPYYPYNTFCPGQIPGFLGDSCTDDDPCYNDYSIECRNGTCSCIQNHIPSSQNNGLCEYAPSLGQSCDSVCQTPLVCQEKQDSTTQPPKKVESVLDNAETVDTTPATTPPPSSPSKTCQCAPPYTLHNGYYCSLDCPSDEYYDEKDGKCKPRCKADEVKLSNGYCAPVAKLGEKCYDDLQCTQEYSRCKKGKCACEPGFQAKNGECVPRKYSCPWSKPLRKNGSVIECNITQMDYYPSYQQKDTCPSNAFCLTSPPSAYYPNYVQEGFCCPKPALECPVGEPLLNVTCNSPYIIYYDRPAGSSSTPPKQCPYQTHYCYTVSAGQNYYQPSYSQSLCCPLACEQGFVLVDGVCYQQVQYDDQCVVNEQCAHFNGICGNGTCQCPPNGRPVNYGGPYTYCSIECGPDEVLIGQQCYKRHKLGEPCGDDPTNLCPYNAGCDPDQNNTCQCYCNYIAIGDNRCEYYPVCRQNYYYPYYAEDTAGSSGTATDNAETTSTCYDTTTQASPPQQGNYTFCRVKGQNPPVDAVENCPEGQYCSYYLYDLGQCCPIPDPVCPNRSPGTNEGCSPKISASCPSDQYCYTYYQAVGGQPSQGTICCSNY